FFLGVQPAVIALIVRAVHRIGSHVLLDAWLWAIGVVSAVTALLGVSFWITLPTAGLLYAFALGRQYIAAAAVLGLAIAVILGTGMLDRPAEITAASVPPHAPQLIDLFLSGLKAGL